MEKFFEAVYASIFLKFGDGLAFADVVRLEQVSSLGENLL